MGVSIDSKPIRDLADDYGRVPARATRAVDVAVEGVAKDGNQIAVNFARVSAGDHGKRYPKAFRVNKIGNGTWAYGPLSNLPQGDMDFEHGSRNQPAHNDLAKSADQVAQILPRRVGDACQGTIRGR